MALPTRKGYTGNGVQTTLSGSTLNDTDTSTTFSVATGTLNWPPSNFYIVMDPGTSKEEKMFVTSVSGASIIATRGVDNTTKKTHAEGAVVYPVFSADEADEANMIASAMTTKGDLIATNGTDINCLAIGTNTHVLQADSTATNGFKWGQVATAGIADNAITLGKLATALQAFLVPVGTINAYAGATAPTGWLLCDGTTSTSGYTTLATLVGATTPNLKGKVIVGLDAADATMDTLLETGGSKTVTLLEANLPVHKHTISAYAHATSSTADLAHTHGSGTLAIAGGSHDHTASTAVAGNHQHGTPSMYHLGTAIDHAHTRNDYYSAGPGNFDVADPLRKTDFAGDHGHLITVATSASHSHTMSGSTGAMSANGTHSHTIAEHAAKDTGNTGSATPTSIMQPYMTLNYIIKHD